MKTYLLAWNPKQWNWEDFNEAVDCVRDKQNEYIGSWSCGRNKSIKKGDRIFLIQLGTKESRGICGSGYATSDVFQNTHWSGDTNKKTNYIEFIFDALFDPKEDKILNIDELKTGKLSEQHWSTQNSGIQIKPEVAEILEVRWKETQAKNEFVTYQEVIEDTEKYELREGASIIHISSRYERNKKARDKCLSHYGTGCQICGIDFEKEFGEVAKGLIHVHHITALADIKAEHRVNPIKDLLPVCPNCHALIHRFEETLKLEEIKKILITSE